MEQGAEVEENNQKSDCSPVSKSLGSLIRIDAISIDLYGAMDKHEVANQCDHFSLRGYVAEMRKKDIKICLPFSIDDTWNEAEEQKSILPPLDVAKFKWWSCRSCLREIGASCCAREIGKGSDSSLCRSVSKGSCSIPILINGAARGGASAIACTGIKRDEVLISSSGYHKEKKDEVGQSIPDGSGKDASHQIYPVMKELLKSKESLIPETRAFGSDAMEIQGTSFSGHISSDIRHLENNGSSSAEIGQTGTLIACSQQRINTMDSKIIAMGSSSRSIRDMEVSKGKNGASRSLDDLCSESGDKYFKNDEHDKFGAESSKSVGQRAPKVRLLTELLGSDGNAENDLSKMKDTESDSASDFCDDMTVQTISKQHSKGKRKISQGENEKPLLLPKKSKLPKGNANFAIRKCMVVDSVTEESNGIFVQQKKLKNHLSNKKKHKQIQHKGECRFLIPRPDVAKKYHFAPSEGLSKPAHTVHSNTEMDLYHNPTYPPQAERISDLSEKNKKIEVQQAISVPQWSAMHCESSSVRKNSDFYGSKDVDFSLNSYGVVHNNEKGQIAEAIIGAEPLSLSSNSSIRERCHQVNDIFHARESNGIHKSTPDLGYGKGLLCDLNENIATQSPVHDMQSAILQFGSIQHHQELCTSGFRNSEPKNDDQDKGNDDIPMEIVELMAKNQYERCRDETEINYFSPEQTSEKRKFESTTFPTVHGNRNGALKSYRTENHSVRKPLSRTTTVNSSEHFAPMKVSTVNSFPDINRTSLDVSKMEGRKSAFTRCTSFFDGQVTQSGRTSYPESVSNSIINHQSFQWRSDGIENSFPTPEISYSLVPNYLNFTRSYAPEASNFGANLQIPESSSGGKMAKDLNLNFVNNKYDNFEKQHRDFGCESFRKSSAVDPSASQHNGIDLNAKVSGSLDLNSNEALPAMQLLSLLDAGMKSNPISNSVGNQNMISKPLSPYDYHPKVLGKPRFLSDHKDPFRQSIAISSNGSRPSSSSLYGKTQRRENSSYEFRPPFPTLGPFSSLYPPEGNLIKVRNVISTRVHSKFEEKKKGIAQTSSRKLQKRLQNNHDSNSIHSNQRGSLCMRGTVFPSESIPRSEICFVNRDPADFSIPEPGNIYMINGRDLKFVKKISLKGRRESADVDGKKRQRVTVLAATKMK